MNDMDLVAVRVGVENWLLKLTDGRLRLVLRLNDRLSVFSYSFCALSRRREAWNNSSLNATLLFNLLGDVWVVYKSTGVEVLIC